FGLVWEKDHLDAWKRFLVQLDSSLNFSHGRTVEAATRSNHQQQAQRAHPQLPCFQGHGIADHNMARGSTSRPWVKAEALLSPRAAPVLVFSETAGAQGSVTTWPSLRIARRFNVVGEVESGRKRTEPSTMQKLAPPECPLPN